MHRENGAFPLVCFCRICNSNSGVGCSPSFCRWPHLPTCHIKHRMLMAGFRSQLASAQPVSPGSSRELALACLSVVMALSFESESAFPTSTISFALTLFNVISVWEKHCFRMRVLFQRFPKNELFCDVKHEALNKQLMSCDLFLCCCYYPSVSFSSPLFIFISTLCIFLFILRWLDPCRDTGCLWCFCRSFSNSHHVQGVMLLGEDFCKQSWCRCHCNNCTWWDGKEMEISVNMGEYI